MGEGKKLVAGSNPVQALEKGTLAKSGITRELHKLGCWFWSHMKGIDEL